MIFRLLCIVSFVITIFAGFRFVSDIQRLDQMKQINGVAKDLLIALLNAETGQRGYIITMNQDYLAPYNASISSVPRALNDFDQAIIDTVRSHEEADIRSLTEQKLAELAKTIDLTRQNRQAGVDEVNRHLGKNLMDDIRQHLTNVQLWAAGRYDDFERETTFFARLGYGAFLATFAFGALAIRR